MIFDFIKLSYSLLALTLCELEDEIVEVSCIANELFWSMLEVFLGKSILPANDASENCSPEADTAFEEGPVSGAILDSKNPSAGIPDITGIAEDWRETRWEPFTSGPARSTPWSSIKISTWPWATGSWFCERGDGPKPVCSVAKDIDCIWAECDAGNDTSFSKLPQGDVDCSNTAGLRNDSVARGPIVTSSAACLSLRKSLLKETTII